MSGFRPVVAICGGNNGLGRFIVNAILMNGSWDVIILSRFSRPDISPTAPVLKVNYSCIRSLTKALQGVHTVVSTIPNVSAQLHLIEASLEAGCARFIPAEFEGTPSRRPLFTSSGCDKLSVLRRLDEVRDHLQSTVFVCGLFYEYFIPGGWRACGGGGWDTGSFLLDMKRKTAILPDDRKGNLDTIVCMVSAEDIGKFVACALNMDWWPSELRMWGERLRLKDLVEIAEDIRDQRFKICILSEEELEECLTEAICDGDYIRQQKLQMMQGIQQHETCFGTKSEEFDYMDCNLNDIFPEVQPQSLSFFLRRFWRSSISH